MTKEKINEIIDSGEPLLIVRASDPRAFAVASIVKYVYVVAQCFEQAANARESEKAILKWVQEKKEEAEFQHLSTELGKTEALLVDIAKQLKPNPES